jgi:hypothetical protein
MTDWSCPIKRDFFISSLEDFSLGTYDFVVFAYFHSIVEKFGHDVAFLAAGLGAMLTAMKIIQLCYDFYVWLKQK